MEKYGCHVTIPKKTGINSNTDLTAMAFFLGQPQAWAKPNWSDVEISHFQNTLAVCPNLSGREIVVHGCYLINPASAKEEVRTKSVQRFLEEVQLCDRLGIGNYVFHPGSTKGDLQEGLTRTAEMIKLGLVNTTNVKILVENMTQNNSLGQSYQELDWIMRNTSTDPTRVGICLDTAHAWGAGPTKGMVMSSLLDDLSRIVGIERLGTIHLNDSKVACGSNLDRHENLFAGQIPHSFWEPFIFDPRVRNVPTILETPGNCHPILKQFISNPTILPGVQASFTPIPPEIPASLPLEQEIARGSRGIAVPFLVQEILESQSNIRIGYLENEISG